MAACPATPPSGIPRSTEQGCRSPACARPDEYQHETDDGERHSCVVALQVRASASQFRARLCPSSAVLRVGCTPRRMTRHVSSIRFDSIPMPCVAPPDQCGVARAVTPSSHGETAIHLRLGGHSRSRQVQQVREAVRKPLHCRAALICAINVRPPGHRSDSRPPMHPGRCIGTQAAGPRIAKPSHVRN